MPCIFHVCLLYVMDAELYYWWTLSDFEDVRNYNRYVIFPERPSPQTFRLLCFPGWSAECVVLWRATEVTEVAGIEILLVKLNCFLDMRIGLDFSLNRLYISCIMSRFSLVQFSVMLIWHGMVWYGMVWYGVVVHPHRWGSKVMQVDDKVFHASLSVAVLVQFIVDFKPSIPWHHSSIAYVNMRYKICRNLSG